MNLLNTSRHKVEVGVTVSNALTIVFKLLQGLQKQYLGLAALTGSAHDS